MTLESAKASFLSSLVKEYKVEKPDGALRRIDDTSFDLGHGGCRHRGHHVLHQHVEPGRDAGVRGCWPRNAVAKGLKSKPWVKTSLSPGLPGGGRVPPGHRPAGRPRRARLQPHRLRLHDPASAIRGRCPPPMSKAINDNDIVASAVISGNRNFEGRVNPDVKANYLASPPLVVAYALGGLARRRPRHRTPRPRARTARSTCATSGPRQEEVASAAQATPSPSRSSPSATATCSRATSIGRPSMWRSGQTYHWSDGLHLRGRTPPYFEGMTKAPAPVHRHQAEAPRARPVPRLDHHRPHLPGGLDQGGFPGRPLPVGAPGAPAGLQPVRHAPRQPRSDDAGHLRQHPPQEPDGPRRRGRRHAGTSPAARRCRSTTPRCCTSRRAIPAGRSSPAGNTAPARRATGPPRAPSCSACGP